MADIDAVRRQIGRMRAMGPNATIAQAAHAFYEDANPALLAATDLDEEIEDGEPEEWWSLLYAHSQGRLQQLRNWRYSWWLHDREKARLILPYRYHWFITPNQMNRGNPVNQDIIDPTGTLAMRTQAASLYSGLMGPSRPWIKYGELLAGDADPEPDVAHWLEDSTKRLLSVFAGSNFYTSGATMFKDVSTFNTSPMIIYADSRTTINCYVPCAGEYMLAKDGSFRHDTLYREFVMTTHQLVSFFGYENCPEDVREMWRRGGASLEFERVVAHAIEPNFQLQGRDRRSKAVSVLPGHYTYRELYWLRNEPDSRPLSLRGFYERPFIVMGWEFTSNDAYAHGPADEALGAINQLQHMTIKEATYIDHFVEPPMSAPPELRNQPASTHPGTITYTTMDAAFKPAFQANPAGFGPLGETKKECQQRIERIFHNDDFMAISQMEGVQPRERLELTYRMAEKIQKIGPIIENAEVELGYAVYRVSSIMHRRGMFLPMPARLRERVASGERPVKIVYISQMKQLQNAAETAAIQATAQFAGSLDEAALAAGRPPPSRCLNGDDTLRRYNTSVGGPGALVFSPQVVAQHDAMRAKQAQMAQMAQVGQTALPAVQAAQALSQTPVGGNSALDMLLGTQGGAGGGRPQP